MDETWEGIEVKDYELQLSPNTLAILFGASRSDTCPSCFVYCSAPIA